MLALQVKKDIIKIMLTYQDYLKELEIRVKDLCITFRELKEKSIGIEDDEAAYITFTKCSMLLKTLAQKEEGFKQLLESSLSSSANSDKPSLSSIE